ncbi:MAG: hypothetical protein NTX25_22255 [Proteobacteria bacterium]|nr:hypothetical protein [Pseudomonadota bacterium]
MICANIDERQAALTLLESPEADELDIQDDRDDSLHDRGEARQTKSSFSKAPDAAAVKPQPLNSKSNSKKSKGHRLSAITFPDGQTLRIAFESGDYLEIDLGLLNGDEERRFRFGELSLSVTKTHEGYVLLIDGMRLFHPNDSLLAVS